MNNNLYEKIFTHLITLVCGVLIALTTNSILSKKQAKKTFYETILEVFEGMYPNFTRWPEDSFYVLKKKIPTIEIAIEKLKPHLSAKEKALLNEKWTVFKNSCKKVDDKEIKSQSLYPSSNKERNHKEIFANNLKEILRSIGYKNI
jgi:hypothetical protein